MAVSAYTGPPGAGKSYALVAEVIVPAVMAGRRVVTNVEGVKPDTIVAHCIAQGADVDSVGSVVTFHGEQAQQPGFFPTETIPDTQTFVKAGDLLVFDEWRLYFDNSKLKGTNPDLEPFLRWHRHLVGPDGRSCDVVIGTQLIQDVHRQYRGVIHRSFKMKKLDAINAKKAYSYYCFEGHLQPKNGHHNVGHGRYSKEIYALYSSYAGVSTAVEAKTDRRGSMFSRGFIATGVVAVLMLGVGVWRLWSVFSPADVPTPGKVETVARAASPGGAVLAPPSPFRIVGHIVGDLGTQVIVATDAGALRVLGPDGFTFSEDGRPIAGVVEGQRVQVEERITVKPEGLLGL